MSLITRRSQWAMIWGLPFPNLYLQLFPLRLVIFSRELLPSPESKGLAEFLDELRLGLNFNISMHHSPNTPIFSNDILSLCLETPPSPETLSRE